MEMLPAGQLMPQHNYADPNYHDTIKWAEDPRAKPPDPVSDQFLKWFMQRQLSNGGSGAPIAPPAPPAPPTLSPLDRIEAAVNDILVRVKKIEDYIDRKIEEERYVAQ